MTPELRWAAMRAILMFHNCEGTGGLYTYRYTVTTRMTSALRWAAVRDILMFHNCDFIIVRDKVTRQCPQTTTFEEEGEPKRIRTEVPHLTSLTLYR